MNNNTFPEIKIGLANIGVNSRQGGAKHNDINCVETIACGPGRPNLTINRGQLPSPGAPAKNCRMNKFDVTTQSDQNIPLCNKKKL